MNQDLTLRQLRCRAKERGIEGYSQMNKDQLIASLAELEDAQLVSGFVEELASLSSQVFKLLDRLDVSGDLLADPRIVAILAPPEGLCSN